LGRLENYFKSVYVTHRGSSAYYVGEVGENFGELAEYGAESGEFGDRAIGDVGLY
jgi:hypothetical protein